MPHITYAPVDRQFRRLERDLPPGAPFNGVDPVEGITFGFSLSSRYPLPAGEPDIRYGTVEGEVSDDPAILLRVISEAEYDAAYEAEMAAREAAADAATFAGIPVIISDRQFGQGLYEEEIISFDECRAFVSVGDIPAQLQAIIDAIPDQKERERAIILVSGAKEYRHDNPLTEVVRQSFGWSRPQLAEFWRMCAAL